MSESDLKKNNSPTELLAQLDQLTKQGQRLQVLKELARVLKANPSAELRPQLARIANRNHAYVLALRLLHPLIRDDREKIQQASAEALTVYATSLMWIGALEESHECLQRLQGLTDSLLPQAFLYFAQWDYQKSIPVLLTYIQTPTLTPYQKLVGQINLLAAYVALGDLKKALEVYEPLISELKSNPNYKLLTGNCLELRGQIAILDQSYLLALEYLAEAESFLSDQPGRYLLYVNKWKAIAQLGISPTDQEALDKLRAVKAEALKLKNWETVRDCDFHLARLSQDSEFMQRLLLGTPYKAYHARIKSLYGITLSETKTLTYCPGDIESRPLQAGLDLSALSDQAFLNSTSWPLLQLMTKDIYRPPRMGVVFSELYKNEYFDPFTSPQRVRNSLFRFNHWASEQGYDFRLYVEEGDFQFRTTPGTSITCEQRARPLTSWQASLKVFKAQNQSRSFTSQDLADALGLSQRNSVQILKKALESKKIEKIGQGKNSRYIFFSGRRASKVA